MFKYKFIILLSFIGVFYQCIVCKTHIKNIVFDIDGVLFLQNSKKIAGYMIRKSSFQTLAYMSTTGVIYGKKAINERLFGLLSQYTGAQIFQEGGYAHDNQGNILPHIFCQWLDGSLTSPQVLDVLWKQIFSQYKNFKTRAFWEVCSFIFDPQRIVQFAEPNKKMWDFLIQLTQSKQEYKVYILSNYASDAFNVLYEKYQHLFSFVPRENIFVSGDHHCIKPHTACFLKFLETYNIKPNECFFIDDQEANVLSARSVGISAFHYHNQEKLSHLSVFQLLLKSF